VAAWPRILISLAIVVPYWRLVTLNGMLVTDDRIYSDVWNGELPPRVLFGEVLRSGHYPSWSSRLCGGGAFSLAAIDPLSFPTFGLLPAVAALDVFLLAILLLIGHSTYSLGRALGASRPGSMLSAIAFTYSGYVVCQLKHLALMATIAWIPLALLCLERALAARAIAKFEHLDQAPDDDRPMLVRLQWLLGFAAVFGAQVLAGFPQSVYIAALLYGTWAIVRGVGLARRDGFRRALTLLSASALAVALGAAMGAVVLRPLHAAAGASDRAQGLAFEWASAIAYNPQNIMTFFVPYVNGDVSDGSYHGPGIFWEDYGYVGLATVLLTFVAVARSGRRPHVLMLAIAATVAFLLVLGPATPLFKLAFHALPGMKNFRFPTRFLVLVDLAIALLGGLGLSELQRWIARRFRSGLLAQRGELVAGAIVAITLIDLVHAQMRQNPIVDGRKWLEPPGTAKFLRAQSGLFRIWTPFHMLIHVAVYHEAGGWADVTPYYEMRDLIQPNSNIYWGLDSADCYVGLGGRDYVDVWGDHNRPGMLVTRAIVRKGPRLEAIASLYRVLRMFNVRYVLSPWELNDPDVRLVDKSTPVRVYEVTDVLPRAFVVGHAYGVTTNEQAADRILFKRFDPARDVVLHDAPPELTPKTPKGAPVAEIPGTAELKAYGGDEVIVETSTSVPGFLVSSDAFGPWETTIDGAPTPLYRANMTGRAIALPAGNHTVVFRYVDRALHRAALVSAAALALHLSLVAIAFVLRRRSLARAA
jgi:hypothetical protein